MTEEEFENIVNKTCEMSLTNSSEAAVNFWKMNNQGSIEIEELEDIVWTEVFFTPFDSKLKAVGKMLPSANALYLYWLSQGVGDIFEEFPYVICEATNRNQSLIFATSNLDEIQTLGLIEGKDLNELFEQDIGDCRYASPWYLLVNPRKQVVEWALKNFDYNSYKVTCEWFRFIDERQAIPELKELIINTLEKQGE